LILSGRIAQGSAQQRDIARERYLFHKRAGPKRLHEVILFDEETVAFDQQNQSFENFRRQSQVAPVADQATLSRFEMKRTKSVSKSR
jgi:hypothetical protein